MTGNLTSNVILVAAFFKIQEKKKSCSGIRTTKTQRLLNLGYTEFIDKHARKPELCVAHEASTSDTKVISKLTIIFISYGKSPSCNQSSEVLAELVPFN